jgi:anti-anti-sigma regulatory factor
MSHVIKLPENITIHYVSEHMNSLKSALGDATGDVDFDASQVETLDTAGIQLMLVILKTLVGKNVKVRWVGANDVFTSSIEGLGLADKFSFA